MAISGFAAILCLHSLTPEAKLAEDQRAQVQHTAVALEDFWRYITLCSLAER